MEIAPTLFSPIVWAPFSFPIYQNLARSAEPSEPCQCCLSQLGHSHCSCRTARMSLPALTHCTVAPRCSLAVPCLPGSLLRMAATVTEDIHQMVSFCGCWSTLRTPTFSYLRILSHLSPSHPASFVPCHAHYSPTALQPRGSSAGQAVPPCTVFALVAPFLEHAFSTLPLLWVVPHMPPFP